MIELQEIAEVGFLSFEAKIKKKTKKTTKQRKKEGSAP